MKVATVSMITLVATILLIGRSRGSHPTKTTRRGVREIWVYFEAKIH